MILALLAAAAVPPVEQAERAFASMAQTKGQWTAFRAFAAPDAQMMIEGPQPAAPFLHDRKDPPVAVMWWPAHTVTSCDGTLAFSTGPWRRKGGLTMGHYLTIWRHDAAGWRWIYDGGAEDHSPSLAGDKVRSLRASCGRMAKMPVRSQHEEVGGASRDGSLQWSLISLERQHYALSIYYWTTRGWKTESANVG
jgi:hypothetical protein